MRIRILKHQAYLTAKRKGPLVVGEMLFGEILAAEPDPARCSEMETVEDAEQCGFSGTVGAQQSHAAGFGNGQAQIVEAGITLVAVGQAVDLEEH